jgi:outer membrane receptor for ferrienterochelin and colicins
VRELEEVVITATRSERTMGSLPMPVTLIQTPMIKTMGSVRLNDVLTEQTGLVVVPQINGQGNGIQIQGFNPDYTLILIDGEPLIGRYTGSLELSRLTVGNIKKAHRPVCMDRRHWRESSTSSPKNLLPIPESLQ